MYVIRTYKTCLFILIFFLPQMASAFDDDSTDDTRSLLEIRTICHDGKTILDTDIHRSSCRGDDVYFNQLETGLFKNGAEVTHDKILDFKVARNGNLYYRTEFGPYLYNEKGQINSNGSAVILFLVSSSGDVVALTDQGDIFKNGIKLDRGAARVPVTFAKIKFLSKQITLIENPIVSRNGKVVYLNGAGHLYSDGKRINSTVSHVVALKLNSTGDVYFIDDNNRLYRNTHKLFGGRFNILEFQLTSKGQVVYLTDSISRNLFLEDKVLSSGSQKVVSFSFNSSGEIIYQDELGRLWKSGRRIGR